MRNDSENRFVGQNIFFDLFIIITLLGIFIWAIDRFLGDILPSTSTNQEPFGFIIESKNDVRAKSLSDLVWHGLRTSLPVADGDYVFAGKNSQAKIQIKNSTVSIGSNTLIQLRKSQASVDIDYRKGSLKIENNAASAINVQIAKSKKKLEIKNASVLVLDDKKNLRVQVSSGSVDIGDGIVVSQNDQITLGEDNKIILENFDTSFLSPINGSVVLHKDNKIQFTLSTPIAERTWIWISTDPMFKNKISKRWDPNVPNKVVAIPEDGLYYYQLFDINGKAKTFQAQFTKQIIHRPELFSPVNKSLILDHELSLLWVKPNMENYKSRIQVAKDVGFSELLWDELSAGDSLSFKSDLGNYFWRVRSEKDDFASDWSEIRKFELADVKKSKLDISISRNKIPLIDGKARFKIQASSIKTNTILKLTILKEKKAYKTFESLNNQIEVQLEEIGSFDLQVSEIDQAQKIISTSDSINIDVIPYEKLPAPSIDKELIEIEIDENKDDENQDLTTQKLKNSFFSIVSAFFDFFVPSAHAQTYKKLSIKWKSVPGAVKYKFIIAKDKDFNQIVEQQEISDTKISWRPSEAGTYFWKVYAIDEFDKLGTPSVIAEIRAKPARKKLPAPSLEKFEILSDSDGVEVQLKWQSIPKAVGYKIQYSLVNQSNNLEQENEIQVSENSFEKFLKLLPGEYILNIYLQSESEDKKRNLKSDLYSKFITFRPVPIVSKKREQVVNFSFTRFEMGKKWENVLKNFSGKSVQTAMNMLNIQYQSKFSDLGWLIGLSYFRTSSEDILAQGINYQIGINTSLLTSIDKLSFDPQLVLGAGPSFDEGMLLYQLQLPLKWSLKENLQLTFGPGYALGSFYGIERPDVTVNPNIQFGGLSFTAGLSYRPN